MRDTGLPDPSRYGPERTWWLDRVKQTRNSFNPQDGKLYEKLSHELRKKDALGPVTVTSKTEALGMVQAK